MADRTCSAYKCTLLCIRNLLYVRLTEVLNETCSDYWPGIVSSIGNNQQEVPASLREGRSGITFSQELKDSGMRSHVWGNVKLDTTGLIDRKVVRFMSDASIYAFLSMEQAIADAGLSPEAYQNNPRVGLIAGSGGGSPRFQVFGADAMRGPRGLKAVGPYVVTQSDGIRRFCLPRHPV